MGNKSSAFLPETPLSTLKLRDPNNKGDFAILYQINLAQEAYKISQLLNRNFLLVPMPPLIFSFQGLWFSFPTES